MTERISSAGGLRDSLSLMDRTKASKQSIASRVHSYDTVAPKNTRRTPKRM